MYSDGARHARTQRLIGADALGVLRASHVTVVGLGGVGGACVEALARAGVGALTLIDGDVVAPSNLNRQLVATMDTVGALKCDAAVERVKAIDPVVTVYAHAVRITGDNIGVIPMCDFLIDAVDDLAAKVALAVYCKRGDIPMAASMGAGNRLDPTAFRIMDITHTHGDPLARAMRKRYKEAGIERLTVVCSEEPPRKPEADAEDTRTPSSISFVPPVAGLALASVAVRYLLGGI